MDTMDQRDEDLKGDLKDFLRILFPDGNYPAQLEYDPEQLSYLARLGSQGLDSLNGEVARLNEEVAIVEHQTRGMASQNYQIFVQSAQTTNQIKKSLEAGNEQLVQQLEGQTFSRVKSGMQKFSETSCKEFASGQKSVELMLSNQDCLSTVLEMPWLVRRCLADEKLPNAIKILQVAQDMIKSVSDPPIVLSKTCDEVMELKTEIQHALLSKLASGTIGLSECLQTVSLLRSFFPDDKSLRFRFLQSRMKDIHFDQARTWVFDTLTQHRAAFGGDSNHYLSTWVALQIQRVLADMHKLMEAGESIDTLMTQATYFGESFARVGADLRGLIVPIFTDFIVKRFQQGLYQAEVKLCRHLRTFNLSSIAQFANPDSANLDLPPAQDLNPPKQLISHMPLAQYLNDVLSLLNFVAKCPLTQTMPSLVQKLNSSLAKMGEELVKWGESEWLTWELREQSEFNRMKRYFEHLLVPHLDKVFRVVFPPENISKITGLGVATCSNMMQIKYNSSTSDNVSNTTNVDDVTVST